MYYYVIKEGVYIQAVVWIGDCKEEAMKTAINCAMEDEDNYHDWVAYQYGDVEDEEIISVKKDEAKEEYDRVCGGDHGE